MSKTCQHLSVDAVGFGQVTDTPRIVPDLPRIDHSHREAGILQLHDQALFQAAARLSWFELARPARVIGGNTVEAMQSGAFHGFVSLIEGMVSRFKAELGDDARVVATGGWSELIGRASRGVDHVEPLLTLEGLRLVWEERSSPP